MPDAAGDVRCRLRSASVPRWIGRKDWREDICFREKLVGAAGFEPATPSSRTRWQALLFLYYRAFLPHLLTSVRDLDRFSCGVPVALYRNRSHDLQPSGYERATLAEKVRNYWHFCARARTHKIQFSLNNPPATSR